MIQLALELDLPTQTPSCPPPEPDVPMPGACQNELKLAYTSSKDKGKSLCTINHVPVWTNCREWGRCTMRGDVFGGRT